MTLESRKISLIKAILSINDERVFESYEALLKKAGVEAYEDKLRPMTMEEYKARIQKAEKDIAEGKLTDIEDVIEESEKWLKR